jgi:ABC transporter
VLSVHRLVRTVTRHRLSPQQTGRYQATVNRLFGEQPLAEAYLSIRSLCASYRDRSVIVPVDLDIPRNQVTAIIGPSGSGKSTLLRCLSPAATWAAGIRIAGTVLFNDRDIYSTPDWEPDPYRVPLMTSSETPLAGSVYDSVAIIRPRRARERRLLDNRVEEALRTVSLWDGVKHHLRRDARRLSTFSLSGDRVRGCAAPRIGTLLNLRRWVLPPLWLRLRCRHALANSTAVAGFAGHKWRVRLWRSRGARRTRPTRRVGCSRPMARNGATTCGYSWMVCVMAKLAAGVRRSSHLATRRAEAVEPPGGMAGRASRSRRGWPPRSAATARRERARGRRRRPAAPRRRR